MIDIALNGEGADIIRILIVLTVLSMAPFMLLMMTCFSRVVIVFSFMRSALGLQQTPPNQVLVGLALFVSFFIMAPVIDQIYEEAYQPYSEGLIESQEFMERAQVPLKEFMLQQTTISEAELYKGLSRLENINALEPEELPMSVIVPAFITSELKRAFTIGFLLFVPFLIIDLIVASTLMSMGIIMLPPVMISLPFKIMLFVVVDGWGLLIRTLLMTYN